MDSPRRTIIAGTGTIVAGIAGAWTVFSDEGKDTPTQSDENNETEHIEAGQRDERGKCEPRRY